MSQVDVGKAVKNGSQSQTVTVPSLDRVVDVDPLCSSLMLAELQRQEETLELIPSENIAPPAVLQALGSWLNNKYAEGTPGKRYYGGCQVVDKVETLAQERACALFGAEHANVQPHSGSNANMAVYAALLQPGDTVLGMALDHGGHLTHGSPVNFSGKLYSFHSYTVSQATGRVEYDEVREIAEKLHPKLIVAGYSAYPRILDWKAFADIAHDVGALFMVDMAHVAGLVAGGAHPSPVPYADVVTMTTHKTLRGPWGGLILCKAELADAIDKAVFPGTQGGPHLHAIAAKAVMLHLCGQEEFKTYATTVVSNAHVLAHELMERDITLVTGGTDNHLMLIDLRPLGVQGRSMQLLCDEAGITLNANTFPYHGGSPFNPNGLRLGTPSVTSRGMHGKEMIIIADLLSELLHHADDPSVVAHVREGSLALCQAFPLPYRV